jgi:hypothetical protein
MNLLWICHIFISFSFLVANKTRPLNKCKEEVGLHTIDLIDLVVRFTLNPLLMFTMVLSIEGIPFQNGYNTFLIVPKHIYFVPKHIVSILCKTSLMLTLFFWQLHDFSQESVS